MELSQEPTGGDPRNYVGAKLRPLDVVPKSGDVEIVELFVRICILRARLALLRGWRS